MNIGLISPYPSFHAYGVRLMSACLKRAGHKVKVLFLPHEFGSPYETSTLEKTTELLSDADLVGISVMTNFFSNSVQITRSLKRTLTVPVVWGGIHPTLRPRECLAHADIVCLGEAEETIVELAEKMQAGYGYQSVRGTCLNHKGQIILNERRPLPQDLDSLPFPDYDHKDHYVVEGGRVSQMSEGTYTKNTNGVYFTLPTRGCPFGCAYCNNNAIHRMYPSQTGLRLRSISNVIHELVLAKSRLSTIRTVKFYDDAFFLYSTQEIEEFSRQYRREVGLPLMVAGITPTTLTGEKLAPLVDAGLVDVRMGIQTASERTKRLYGRDYPNERVLMAAKIINGFKDRIGPPQYDIILDNPWETEEDLIETLMFLTRLPRPYRLMCNSLTFFPETDLHKKAKEEGLIVDEPEDVYHKRTDVCRKSYLNDLFALQSLARGRVSSVTMSLLTDRKIRRLGLGRLIAGAIWLWYAATMRVVRTGHLLSEGLRDIVRGDSRRITWYVRKKTVAFLATLRVRP